MKNKRFTTWALLLSFITATLFMVGESYAAAKKSKISIMAKARSEKSDDEQEDERESGSSRTETYIKSETELVTLALQIKNGEDKSVTGELKWCFISDHSSGKSKKGDTYTPEESAPATFSSGKKEITLEPLSVLDEIVVSEPFLYEEKTTETENFNNGNTTSRDSIKGDVYKGYLLLFTVNGEVVAMKSNTSRYKKDEWVKKCLNP